MGWLQDIKYRLRKSGLLMLFVALFFYFVFNAFCGDRGVQKYLYLKKEVEYAKTVAEQYRVKKENLNNEVRLLSPGSLDLDMLDERARSVLNLAGSSELMILDEN
ncbi:MAG: septum formation initiator family protein [Alphaproteobacteria bacterium]|nr:septum formation initiator family protein [Alphaproteobacteria bacterium]